MYFYNTSQHYYSLHMKHFYVQLKLNKIKYYLALLFLLLGNISHAQSPEKARPVSPQKMNQDIKKRRLELLVLVEQADFNSIKTDEKIHDFYVLTVHEQLDLLLLQGEYYDFLKLTNKETAILLFYGFPEDKSDLLRDRGYISDYHSVKRLSSRLKQRLVESKDFIRNEVLASTLNDDNKEYILFVLENTTHHVLEDIDNAQQLKVHDMACDFLRQHPTSKWYDMVDSRRGKFYEPTWLAGDINVGFGFGGNIGSLNTYVNRRWGMDLDIKIYLHSTFLGVRGDVNFNFVKQDIFFEDEVLPGGEDAFFLSYYDFYLGRRFDFFNRFTILPFAGYGFTEFYYVTDQSQQTYSDRTRYVSDWHYGFDLNVNFKKQRFNKTHTARFKRTLSQHAGYFRISFVVHNTGLQKLMPELSGTAYGIYFGFGAHFRRNKSQRLCGRM